MSNESMANYITETPSDIAELLAENASLKAHLAHIDSELKENDELISSIGWFDECDQFRRYNKNECAWLDRATDRARQRIKERKEFNEN